MQTLHVTVIIPVYDDPSGLAVCLRNLANQDYPTDCFDVIVVDNGSPEPLKLSAPRPKNTRLICETKPGSYAARNAAIREAHGAVIAFTDADCAPAPDWISSGVEHLAQDPKIGLVAGRIESPLPTGRDPHSVELYQHVHAFPQEHYALESHFGATANVFTRRQVLDEVGFFNESLQSGGDREWGNRVHAAGWKVVYGQHALIDHPPRTTWTGHWKKLVRVHEGERDRRNRAGQPAHTLLTLDVQDIVPPVKTIRRISAERDSSWDRQTKVKYAVGATLARWAGVAARWKVGVAAAIAEQSGPLPLRSGRRVAIPQEKETTTSTRGNTND